MADLGRSQELTMYYGAKKHTILRARELRKLMTCSERILWGAIKGGKIEGAHFRRQHPMDIFIADFYCHQYKLVIEVDGGIHKVAEVAERDRGREYEIERFGVTILRFTNDEVNNRLDFVVEKIAEFIRSHEGPTPGPSPKGVGSSGPEQGKNRKKYEVNQRHDN